MGHARSGAHSPDCRAGACAQVLAGGGAIGGVLSAQAVKSTAPWRSRLSCGASRSYTAEVAAFLPMLVVRENEGTEEDCCPTSLSRSRPAGAAHRAEHVATEDEGSKIVLRPVDEFIVHIANSSPSCPCIEQKVLV